MSLCRPLEVVSPDSNELKGRNPQQEESEVAAPRLLVPSVDQEAVQRSFALGCRESLLQLLLSPPTQVEEPFE